MKKTIPLLFLAVLACLIAAERWHTYREPLQGDITFYALLGHELRLHRTLYDDLIDHKPPAIYATYAISEGLTRAGPGSVLLANIAAALVTLCGVYWAAYLPRRSFYSGLWAAALWATVCGDLTLEANQPNAEVFINACLIWAFVPLLQPQKLRGPRTFYAGILLALSTLFWQAALPIALCLLAAHSAFSPSENRRDRIAESLAMGATVAGAWVLTTLYFVLTRRGQDFYDLLFAYNRFYTTHNGSLFSHVLRSFHPTTVPIDVFVGTGLLWGPLVLLCLTGLGLGTTEKSRPAWLRWLAYAAGVQLTIILSANFFSHYYQLWLPVLAVGSGWAIEEIEQKAHRTWAGTTAGILALGSLLAYEIPFYRLSPVEWSIRKYGAEFLVTQKLGEDLRSLLKPEESFYEWGMQTGLYYWSGHLPPTGAFYNYFLMTGPLAERLSRRVLTELDRDPPDLFIAIHWMWPGAQRYETHPVYQWARQHYRPFEWEAHRGSFIFYALRGGSLEARILRGEAPAHFLDKR